MPLIRISRRHDWRRTRRSAIAAGALILFTAGPAHARSVRETVPASASFAQPPRALRDTYIAMASRRFGIPEHWIRAVIRIESGGSARAVSRAGAMGLMQIMPATWATLSARYRLGDDPYHVGANIFAGTAYLREMFDRYGDLAIALAAYNAGPGRVDAHLRFGRALPSETRTYVARLMPGSDVGGGRPSVGTAPSRVQRAHRPTSDWREAGIFVGRVAVSADAAPAPSTMRSADAPDSAHGVRPFPSRTAQSLPNRDVHSAVQRGVFAALSTTSAR